MRIIVGVTMAENTKISWADHTFNPVVGCEKVSAGCANCYAEEMMDKRFGRVQWGPQGERVRTSDANWKKPHKWNRDAERAGKRARVFCASLADVFDLKWPPGVREDLWKLIHETPCLDWLLLTKRPENIFQCLPANWWSDYRHVWFGVSCENQATYERRWPILVTAVRARVRFISYEPALGPLNLSSYRLGTIIPPDWIICGGESGRDARFMHPNLARSVRNQCREIGIPFHMKQMSRGESIPEDLQIQEFPR